MRITTQNEALNDSQKGYIMDSLQEALMILSKIFFIKDNVQHLLVLQTTRDVEAKEIVSIIGDKDFEIQNVYLPSHEHNVVKVELY